ncbi:MAG: DUF433 domain-containing protein [Deltaproteobacteria bacterium]|nr:DUF433 domain-containing protein [Nannocystaceae bacterium]
MKSPVDPRDKPAYTLPEAAAYARVRPTTAKEWLVGRSARDSIRRRSAPAIISPASNDPLRLSFINLVELFVLADLRRVHGLSLQRVRTGLRYVERELGIERPLVHAKFRTNGVDLFVDHLVDDAGTAKLIEASGSGQVAIREALQARLARVDWDRHKIAARLFPFVRGELVPQPRTIVIDPRTGFGRPVIATTGIRTSVVAGRFRAGESAPDLARDYNLEVGQIEDAVRCEIASAA